MSKNSQSSSGESDSEIQRKVEHLAFVSFKRAADNGHDEAAYQVARMLLNGVGCKADPALSARYAQQAAEAGIPEGCVFYAVLKLRDTLLSGSCSEAVELLRKAASLGSVRAYLLLGQMYANGIGVPKDVGKGLEYTCLAAGMGSEIADDLLMNGTDVCGWPQDPALRCQLLEALERFLPATAKDDCPTEGLDSGNVERLEQYIGRFLSDSPQRDFVVAASALTGKCSNKERVVHLAKLQAAAEAGVPGASTFLAVLSSEGRGVTDDDSQIASYIRADAERGWPQAQYLYSKMLDAGQGGERAPEEAFAYCKKAADAGYVDACFALGQMFRLGHNTDVDRDRAVQYLRQAANFGHPNAMYVLAFMYFHGEGVETNVDRCVSLLKRAAELGHVESMYSFAEFCKGDLGYPADAEAACEWMAKAALEGHPKAQAIMGSITRNSDNPDRGSDSADTNPCE